MEVLRKIFDSNTMNAALKQFGDLSLMDFLLYSLLGILIVIIVTLLCRLFNVQVELSDILTGVMLSVYISVIIQLTLVCRTGGSRIGIEWNLFHGLLGADNAFKWLMMAYVVLNCMLFVPFGFILSLFSFIHERLIWVQFLLIFLISLIATLTIETSQLITGRGYYEIQDIAVNVLGGIIGWIVFTIINHIIYMVKKVREK